jgi:hypothetical protein
MKEFAEVPTLRLRTTTLKRDNLELMRRNTIGLAMVERLEQMINNGATGEAVEAVNPWRWAIQRTRGSLQQWTPLALRQPDWSRSTLEDTQVKLYPRVVRLRSHLLYHWQGRAGAW